MTKKWKIKTKLKPDNKRLTADKIVEALLKNRGLKTKKKRDKFLTPPNPYNLPPQAVGIKKRRLNKAVKRIKQAVENQETIVVYGDYDADGICATAIVWEVLNSLQAQVFPFIPDRKDHGYGLNKQGLREVISKFDPQLVITVDNGIVAHQPVKWAAGRKIEVIITDHHQPGKKLPSASALVWSDQISGAGVAWFLAREVYQRFKKSLTGFKAGNYLELAAIGTITDVMPLIAVNRSLVKYGLQELRKSQRPGLKSLCQQAGVCQQDIEAYHLGYVIGPRLNAMGRLKNATDSLRLLCTNKKTRADQLAAKLGLVNRRRQQLTESTFNHARSAVKMEASKLLFSSHSSYNQGVVGLVAGKLVREFYRPAVVISQEKEYSKGSARSIKGFNLIESLRKFEEIFEDLGGHPMAAGFTIATEKIGRLEKELRQLLDQELDDQHLQPIIEADMEIGLEDINWKLVKELDKFAPFGAGNPQPLFIARNIKVLNARTVGRKDRHLKLRLASNASRPVILEAIAFNQGDFLTKLSPGQLVDICFVVYTNIWNGRKKLELKIKDIKITQKNNE